VELFLLVLVVAFAGCFAFINGFHDVSNAVATSVRTRALTPGVAVVLASVCNLAGALISSTLALVISTGWIGLPEGRSGLGILLAGLLSACAWGVFTWWQRMPSSSTHALLGGLIGAGAASSLLGGENISATENPIWGQLILPLLLSPLVAFVLSYLAIVPLTWLARYRTPREVGRTTRLAQAVFAGTFSLGHGLQDGQRTMAVVLLGLAAAGYASGEHMPLWVQLFAAVLLAVGALFGGWRISHTLGSRLVRIDPLHGATAQGVSAAMLFVGAIGLHMPLSSTHTMTAAILGAGSTQRMHAVRWRVAIRVLATWVLTLLATSLVGAILLLALDPML
jgi:PiT family inorganic phosphate transporter